MIYVAIRRPEGLVSGRILNGGSQISIFVAEKLKLVAFIFEMMEHCSKSYNIFCECFIVPASMGHGAEKDRQPQGVQRSKHNWAKMMDAIVLYLKLVRGVQGVLIAYVVRQHITVAHILPVYNVYLNFNKVMIARALIVDT